MHDMYLISRVLRQYKPKEQTSCLLWKSILGRGGGQKVGGGYADERYRQLTYK